MGATPSGLGMSGASARVRVAWRERQSAVVTWGRDAVVGRAAMCGRPWDVEGGPDGWRQLLVSDRERRGGLDRLALMDRWEDLGRQRERGQIAWTEALGQKRKEAT
jgi:hypothetical protein